MNVYFAKLAVLAACVAAAVSGCGGGGGGSSNGVASKSPDAIVSAATNAISGVKSVHVAGSVSSGTSPVSLDLNLVSGKGATGQMSESGLSFQIISVGQTIYIKGSDAFWKHFGGAGAVQLFHGKWLKAPASGQFASLAALTNVQQLFTHMLSSHGTLTKGKTTTVNGQKVIAVNDTSQGGTLYVATTGKPYPVELKKSGTGGGQIVFDRINQPVSLQPPANAIDISKLG